MSGLNSQQRQELYAMISDDTLAGMLVAMRSTERTKLLQEVEQLDQTLMDRVLRYIRFCCIAASVGMAPVSVLCCHACKVGSLTLGATLLLLVLLLLLLLLLQRCLPGTAQ